MGEQALIIACDVELYIPMSQSLKDKRAIVKSIMHRMRNQFNVSVAEIAHLDRWQTAKISFVSVSNSNRKNHELVQHILRWIEENFADAMITRHETYDL